MGSERDVGRSLFTYRLYIRVDASAIFELEGGGGIAMAAPDDWDEEADGHWEPGPGEATVDCLARYFQFSTVSGRHAPFGLWPEKAMCKLSVASPIAHDYFELVLPERLAYVIGGVVLGNAE